MHKLRSVYISGFRGQKRPISIKFAEDANFIIGRNGTGKTSLINLINAGLTVDLPTLRGTRFERLECKLKAKGDAKVSTVRVDRRVDEDGSVDIIYFVREHSKDAGQEFAVTQARRKPHINVQGRRILSQNVFLRDLHRKLHSIFKLKWLSLRRGDFEISPDDDEFTDRSGTDVDRKLEQVLFELTQYFSRLDRLVSEQTAEFQKRWFLSFLATERSNSINLTEIDMEEERSAISAIFEKFGVPPEDYETQIEKHFKLAERATASIGRSASANPQFRDFLVVYDVMRLHTLVEQWEKLLEKQSEIYSPKTNYISIASEMLFRKYISVNRSNLVTIVNEQDSVPINVMDLSSGEKQLLIFLSETLLQEQSPYIFMADEPELSLHVEWQLELVPNLLKINPEAQVVFATHSPDVVGAFQSRLIKMEELVD